jgi:pyruvate-ferredoxin/flavodoxin oxidoreductase
MTEWRRLTGRDYGLIDAYRTEDAAHILVAMGTIADTAIAVVDHLRAQGRPVGCVAVTSFRPFPAAELAKALKQARTIGVVERTDEPLAAANPLTREIQSALYDAAAEGEMVPRVRSFSAGLGSRDVAAGDLVAVFDRLAQHGEGVPRHAVIGIRHPLALPRVSVDLRPAGAWSMRGHSIGGFGSVTTNKLIATLTGELFGKTVQAYPRYGSEKKGLPTTYYLTVAETHINMHSELERVELLCVNDPTAMLSPLTLKGLVAGGAIFMQSPYPDPADVWKRIPPENQKTIRDKKIRVYFCDMVRIAREVASEPDLQMRMQGIVLLGAFLKLTPYSKDTGMSEEQLYAGVEKALRKYFGKRGDRVVQDNLDCVKRGYSEMQEIPQALIQTPA